MKVKGVRLYGVKDIRLEEFEIPEIAEDEILLKIECNGIASFNMGFGGSYDWWKSYGNSWNACFHSAVVSDIHYFSGICIFAPEKTKYQAGDKDRNRGIYKRGR